MSSVMKKIMNMFLLLSVSACIHAQALGDVNGSGSIDIIDALLTAQYYVGLNPQSFLPQYADVNASGGIDIVDALLVAQFYVGLITVFPGATPSPAPTPSGQAGRNVIGYFTSWGVYDRAYFPDKIPYGKITHINYAFANIVNGEIALGDPYADIDKLYDGDTWDQPLRGNFYRINVKYRALYPGIKTLISVGGWTWSDYFSDVALTDASRKKFASSCVAFMKQYYFDGIDIDWEYPDGGGESGNVSRPEDPHNFTLLMAELRSQLDAAGAADGRRYLLTAATSAGLSHIAALELEALSAYVDWLNVMTYDFHGAWDATTGHLANLYATPLDAGSNTLNCDSSVRAYIDRGMPASRLTLGVPFYGRAWGGVGATQNGFGQASTAGVTGSWGEAGYFDYSDIAARGYPVFRDNDAQAPWSYSSADRVFISHDDAMSMRAKTARVKSLGLGGIMIWELSGDRSEVLLDTIVSGLAP